jgi:hypothetical protein
MTFLLLSISYLVLDAGAQNTTLQKAGGMFGLLAAFSAWYVALAGIADESNRQSLAHFLLKCVTLTGY